MAKSMSQPQEGGNESVDFQEQLEFERLKFQEELAKLRASNESELAGLRQALATVMEAVTSLSQVKHSPKDVFLDEFELNRRARLLNDLAKRQSQELDARIAADIAELEDGPRKFTVAMEKNPRMTRTVGATDQANAIGKFAKYFGIRHFGVNVTAEEIVRTAA